MSSARLGEYSGSVEILPAFKDLAAGEHDLVIVRHAVKGLNLLERVTKLNNIRDHAKQNSWMFRSLVGKSVPGLWDAITTVISESALTSIGEMNIDFDASCRTGNMTPHFDGYTNYADKRRGKISVTKRAALPLGVDLVTCSIGVCGGALFGAERFYPKDELTRPTDASELRTTVYQEPGDLVAFAVYPDGAIHGVSDSTKNRTSIVATGHIRSE